MTRPHRGARRRARRVVAAVLAVVLAVVLPTTVHAGAPADDCTASRASRAWAQPLDRLLTLRLYDVTLRDALTRIDAEARVRLAFSPGLLPLERRVCLVVDRGTVGDALLVLLRGSGVMPVAAGANQIVLAPDRSPASVDAVPALARTTGRLERVVVTGTAGGAPERASPFALGVVEEPRGEVPAMRSVAGLLDAAVPGMWVWSQPPTSVLARYGSVRGASSFGVSTPKVYIDGIEVANPLLLTQLDPASVQRIEVIRGPQGAALYGADAISGVVQIITRHDGVGPDAARVDVRGSAGTSSSAFADRGVLTQDHAFALRTGTAARNASLGVAVSTLGAYVPGADARQLLASGSARRVGPRAVLSGTARLAMTNATSPVSPVLAGHVPTVVGMLARASEAGGPVHVASPTRPETQVRPPRDSLSDPVAVGPAGAQRVRQYTLGGSAAVQGSARWSHLVTVGADGYQLAGVAADGMLAPSAVDSALRAARGSADRLSLRASSTAHAGDAATRGVVLTLGIEHSTARERSNSAGTRLVARTAPGASRSMPPLLPLLATGTTWWHNTGALAQGQLLLRDALFLTGGARVEHIRGPTGGAQVALLPMVGTSWVLDLGGVTTKLRGAYGRGIRPARTVARGATWSGGRVEGALTSLDPEAQSGVETGIDVLWGARLGLHATRFDQRASGLVQPVAIVDSTVGGGSGGGSLRRAPRIAYELQNVGAIDNRGWELQATAGQGPLRLAATLSLVTSRVDRLASGYRGDLRAGDRILEVPARTYGVTAGWTDRRWSVSTSVSRATDWINYDRLALADALASSLDGAPRPGEMARRVPVGPLLRRYWRPYDGAWRAGASGSFTAWRSAALTLRAENLFDRQLGEPDNVTVLPGRTIAAGVRTSF